MIWVETVKGEEEAREESGRPVGGPLLLFISELVVLFTRGWPWRCGEVLEMDHRTWQ